MPLKFLKKCRQYNVTSKSLFVISVHHLLDTSTTVDCTISSESKGQECLDNVCQRLLIQQPEFFGLRFIVKGKEDEMKWIDLDRSLSRQLEKYAANTKIFLRVRHYVTTGVRHLSDEVTRYYHFLQLKSDIYEGKIVCDIRTAILLALYCRQAEYDSYHQNDKQTKDYLKKSLVLPKNLQGLANDDNLLDSLILDVLQQNAGMQHLTQTQAEEMYIQCCQQLDGYGEERFHAKDTLGNDLLLGLAINGMVVTAENGRQYFPWKDFHTVTIDKRIIKIEQNKLDGSIVGSFIFSEAEMARYFWKLCITQHKFFKRYIDEESPSMGDVESTNGISIAGVENISSPYGYSDFTDSREDLLLEQQQRATYTPGNGTSTISGLSADHQYISTPVQQHQQQQQQQMPHSLMASASNASGLMTASNISLAASHQSGSASACGVNGLLMNSPHGATWLTEYVASTPQLSGSITDTRLQSSSCLDLSNNNLMQQHSSNSMLHAVGANSNHATHMLTADAHERERLKAMLPTYRPAPDYETAVQLKYRTPSIELSNNINNMSNYQITPMPGTATGVPISSYHAGSQPDVHQAGVYGDGILLGQFAPQRYPDVAQPAAAMHAHHHMNATAAMVSAHNVHTNQSNVYMDTAQRLHIMRSKPPPPYPVNRLSSSSTPDLAVASHRPLLGFRSYVSGSSPDLVSNRNLLNSQYQYAVGNSGLNAGGGGPAAGTINSSAAMIPQYTNSYINHMAHSQHFLPPHGTFENLNMIEEQPSIMSQLRQSAMNQVAAAQAVNTKTYERTSPTLPIAGYRPISAAQLQQQQPQQHQQNVPSPVIVPPIKNITPAPLQRNTINGSIEPIYENVPLPQFNATSSQRNADNRSSGSSSYTTSDAIRNRTSSIQSAPGGIQPPVPAARHHHNNNNNNSNNNNQAKQQIQPQQQQHQHQQHYEQDEISMNIKKFGSQTHADRAACTEFQYLESSTTSSTTPTKRATRSASAAPTIGLTQTPPQQHQRVAAAASLGATTMNRMPLQQSTAMENSGTTNMRNFSTSIMPDDSQSLQQQFNAMNLSASSSTTAASSFYNQTFDNSVSNTTANNITANISNSSTMSGSKETGKRKKRWNLLGRSKTPDKQKSATLGREKSVPNLSANKVLMAQDDLNIRSRWSTGVPKLQPISGQFSKDKLCQILNEKLNDVQLFMEFENIPKRRLNAIYDCALMEENSIKNFDPNFLPYDDNRVRLTPTMENRHGYVNASHISATVGTKQRFYIVAQSPHEELTSRIFWQCIWEADVYLIVQLSEDLNYIPPTSNQRMEFGQFQVYQEFSQTTDRCTTSKLRLYHIQSRRYRSVWHLNYTDWGEQNCPRDVNHFLDFLEELNSVRMASINEVPPGHNTNPPVLIHCLEGGGRSGVTLTADLLLYTLDHNEDLDIPRVVGQLRHQRDSIIPSLAQYKFIYSLLITYLKRTRLI